MNLRCQTLIFVVATGGLFVCTGCGRSPARVQVAQADPAAPRTSAAQAPGTVSHNGRFAFPSDQGGALLRELLLPPNRLSSDSEVRTAPRPQTIPAELAHPELPTSSVRAEPPRATDTRIAVLRPVSPPEGLPLADSQPRATRRPELDGGARVRLPSPDVNVPPPLPMLGVLTVDRVPIQDPTTEESTKAALAAPPPVRANALPFSPRNLPDPFENRDTVELRALPPEDSQPAGGPVQPPRP